MSQRKHKTIVVKIKVGPPARGHYNFQGTKTTFDNRPKRGRTREAHTRQWKGEYD